jgi:hypothetical protein
MSSLDPLGVNVRLYNQISEILHHLETDERVTLKERIAALIAIGRIQIMFMGMRKEKIHDASAGSSVRKYQKVFENGPGRRKKLAGPQPESTADDDLIADAIGDDTDDAA